MYFNYQFISRKCRNNSVKIKISRNSVRAEIALGVKASEEELEDAMSLRPSSENLWLAKKLLDVRDIMESLNRELMHNGKLVTLKEIRAMIEQRVFGRAEEDETKKLVRFYESRLSAIPNLKTRQIYGSTLNKVREFFGPERYFDDITPTQLERFDEYLKDSCPSANARAIHMRNIRKIFNDAIADGVTTSYPFRRFKIKQAPTRKRSLPVDQIRKVLFADNIEPWAEKYRDFFALTFMLIGINTVDLCKLTDVESGRANYVRAKTHKPYSIKIEPEAMELIQKYRGKGQALNVLDSYANYRHFANNLCKGLKAVADACELGELSTYWARHSWATIASSLDIPKDTIAAALGHGGNTVTDIYIDFDQRKVDEANRRVLDWVLYGKK